MFVLRLYIAGRSVRSERALSNMKRIGDRDLQDYELTVIDVLERPDEAEKAGILATPTLVKESPLPTRRIIGDLSNEEKVLEGLSITPRGEGAR